MEKTIVNALQDDFIPFASESLLNFLPSVCDGILPVNRKSIYALYKNGISNDKSYIKMLRASAMAMTYYVYGDMPLNKALKNMGNNSLNYMYLDPKGSFGDKQKRDGIGASARYIECKLSKYAEDMLIGITKNNVPMKRNFDNTEDEPLYLPSIMPNVLLNTTQSIATGEASKIPAHNLIEVCDSFISYIKTKDIDESISMLNGADLSLGGKILYDKNEFDKIYRTGKGSFTLTGTYTYDNKENKVTITEIPYETYIETIEEKIRQQYDKGNFKEIIDIHDGSDKDGIALNIYLKKGTNIDQFILKLRKLTPFECKMSCNFTMIDIDGKTPLLMSLEDIIIKWLQHRKNCLKRELQYDISSLESEQDKLLGLKSILNDLDKAISIIRHSKTEVLAMESLIKEFNLNDYQAKYISTIKLLNMNNEWITKKINKLGEITNDLDIMRNNLDDESYYVSKVVEQLEYVKDKYGKPRMTQIIYDENATQITKDDLVEDYNCNLLLTKDGYLKKFLRFSDNQKLKDGDSIIATLQSNNKDDILLFTNKYNVYRVKCNDITTVQPSALGVYLPSLVQLEQDESIINIITTQSYNGFLLFCYENGKVAKIPMSSYQSNNKKLANGYNTQSKLLSIIPIDKDEDIVLMSSIDKCLVYNTSNINYKSGRNSQGVQVMKSKNDSVVVSCKLAKDVDYISDIEYYRTNNAGVGYYLKK